MLDTHCQTITRTALSYIIWHFNTAAHKSRAFKLLHLVVASHQLCLFLLLHTLRNMSDRVLYWASGSFPAWRALAVLTEKGLKFESKMVLFSESGHKSPEVLAINPRGQVPSFKDGDIIVNESLAIMQYLEETYPEPALMPKDKAAKAAALQKFHEVSVVEALFRACVISKMYLKDDEAFAKAIVKLKEEMPVWEGYLTKNAYLSGPDFNLADISFGTMMIVAQRFGATFDAFPKIKAYVEALKVRPSLVKTSPPHWKDEPAKPLLDGQI